MNNYCKHLKKRKNKPYCNLLKQEIPFCRCQQCGNKEYRVPVKGEIDKMKYKSNNNQMRNSAYSLQISAKALQKMKNKSNKLVKLERKRFSVFTDNMDKCFFCDNPRMDKHEIFRGKNRSNSMKFGFVLPMCRFHHDMYQDDIIFNDHWHKTAQRYFEEHYSTRDEFVKIFRRNYLD